MVREWQGNKGGDKLRQDRGGRRHVVGTSYGRGVARKQRVRSASWRKRTQNDGTNVMATDHLLSFPTLLSARQLSALAMASEPRFAVNTDADINQLLKEPIQPNTRKSTDMWISVFNKFCSEQDINLHLAICSAKELNDALCKFYPSLRTKVGGLYRKASYLASRGRFIAERKN